MSSGRQEMISSGPAPSLSCTSPEPVRTTSLTESIRHSRASTGMDSTRGSASSVPGMAVSPSRRGVRPGWIAVRIIRRSGEAPSVVMAWAASSRSGSSRSDRGSMTRGMPTSHPSPATNRLIPSLVTSCPRAVGVPPNESSTVEIDSSSIRIGSSVGSSGSFPTNSWARPIRAARVVARKRSSPIRSNISQASSCQLWACPQPRRVICCPVIRLALAVMLSRGRGPCRRSR